MKENEKEREKRRTREKKRERERKKEKEREKRRKREKKGEVEGGKLRERTLKFCNMISNSQPLGTIHAEMIYETVH